MKAFSRQIVLFSATVIASSSALVAQNPFQENDKQDFARTFKTDIKGSSLVESPTTTMARMGVIRRMELLRTSQTAALVKGNGLAQELGASGDPLSELIFWHELALNSTALDHAPGAVPGLNAAQEQPGPPRTSRAMAMIHLAMFESVNGLALPSEEKFHTHFKQAVIVYLPPTVKLSPQVQSAAIVQSAYDLVQWLYPGLVVALGPPQAGADPCANQGSLSITGSYACSLNLIKSMGSQADVDAGIAYGHRVADAIKAERMDDNASIPEPSVGGNFVPKSAQMPANYLQWQVDPVSGLKSALGGNWAKVKPFALKTADEFRLPDSEAAIARLGLANKKPVDWPSYSVLTKYSGEKRLTTSGSSSPSTTLDLYYIAKFWAYDGTAGLCAPVRLYTRSQMLFSITFI